MPSLDRIGIDGQTPTFAHNIKTERLWPIPRDIGHRAIVEANLHPSGRIAAPLVALFDNILVNHRQYIIAAKGRVRQR